MKKTMLLAATAMLALGGTAVAQEAPSAPNASPPSSATPPADTPTASEAAPADPAAASDTTAAPTTATTPAPSASGPMATNSTPATPAADPARVQAAQQTVQSGWATYDTGNKGALTPLEFGKWVMAAQGQDLSAQVDRTRQSRAANLPAVRVLNATAAAFSKADTNKDRAIQPDELTNFLAQG